jgi:signal transduction histidine kinase
VVVPAVDDADRTFVNKLLTDAARRVPRSTWGYDLLISDDGRSVRYFASRPMPTYRGDTVIYAIEYTAEAMDSLFSGALSRGDLLPPSLMRNRANADLIDVEVRHPNGGVLFTTSKSANREIDAETSLPSDYGALLIRTSLKPQLAEQLLIGGVPGSRVPLLLLVLVITVVLAVLTTIQLRREARFAADRSNFVANVSHELRTPLTQVRLVLDTLRLGRAADPAAREQALGLADREVLRLQHLVEGVLRYARGPRRNNAPRTAIDAAAEIHAVVREFTPLAVPRNVMIEVTGDVEVNAHLQPGALRQVMLNLLDNALKYGRNDSTVTVDVRNVDRGMQLSVRDRGNGVRADERKRIWRAFERGRTAEQNATGGSGIGLTVVAEIAHEHGGDAWVEDAEGGGARFVVTFAEVKR